MAKKTASLEGERIVLTRQDNSELSERLTRLGADVLEIPLIETRLEANEDAAQDFLSAIASYDWATFSSANGVRGFFREFFKKYSDIRCIGPMRIACVGDATAREIAKYRLLPDIIASPHNARSMADEMLEFESLDNRNILCVGGSLSGKDFMKTLEEKGGAMTEFFEVYKTEYRVPAPDDKILKDFKKHGADFIVFASPSAVESFVKNAKLFAPGKGALAPKAVSIGPSTTEAVKKYSMPLAFEAGTSTTEGILEAFLRR